MISIPLLIGCAVTLVAAWLLYRWLFNGLGPLLGALGLRMGNAPGWKLFHANRSLRQDLLRLIFGVLAPAALLGLGAHQTAQLLA